MTTKTTPTQERSQNRLNSIVEAARQHYRAVGRDRFDIPGVARIAECSPAAVYYYFSDKVALLDHIEPGRDEAAHLLDQVRASVAQPYPPGRAEQVLDEVRALVTQ
jgi:AcrR family transcriptional regulator